MTIVGRINLGRVDVLLDGVGTWSLMRNSVGLETVVDAYLIEPDPEPQPGELWESRNGYRFVILDNGRTWSSSGNVYKLSDWQGPLRKITL